VQCGKAYVDDDIIVINGTDEEIAELQARLESRKLAAKVSFSCILNSINILNEIVCTTESALQSLFNQLYIQCSSAHK